jgi:hypothetical protein
MNIRKSFFFIGTLLIILIGACTNNNGRNLSPDVVTNPITASGKNESKLPVIVFEKEIHDFGKIIQGEKVSFGFKFKNTGNADLVIAQVNSSCGCTTPKFPKTSIKPGEEKVITVMFDSQGRKGIQNKTITVVTNCQPPNTVIRIKAMVIVP